MAARHPWRLAARIEEPVQNAIDSPDDSIVGLGNAKLNQAYQPPMSALPLLVGMAGIFPKQGLDPGICGGYGTPQRSSRT